MMSNVNIFIYAENSRNAFNGMINEYDDGMFYIKRVVCLLDRESI